MHPHPVKPLAPPLPPPPSPTPTLQPAPPSLQESGISPKSNNRPRRPQWDPQKVPPPRTANTRNAAKAIEEFTDMTYYQGAYCVDGADGAGIGSEIAFALSFEGKLSSIKANWLFPAVYSWYSLYWIRFLLLVHTKSGRSKCWSFFVPAHTRETSIIVPSTNSVCLCLCAEWVGLLKTIFQLIPPLGWSALAIQSIYAPRYLSRRVSCRHSMLTRKFTIYHRWYCSLWSVRSSQLKVATTSEESSRSQTSRSSNECHGWQREPQQWCL